MEIYSFETLPVGQECFLMDVKYKDAFDEALCGMIDGANPAEVGFATCVVPLKIHARSAELSWYPNVVTRFHEIPIFLPREHFVDAFGDSSYDVKPRIFVSSQWMEQLLTRQYSLFALVDAIGMKDKLIDCSVSSSCLARLSAGLDEVAERYHQFSFISFADGLIVKSNWQIGYYLGGLPCTYRPETIIEVISEIEIVFKSVLGLGVYAIITQGSNEYHENPALHVSKTHQHICLNSLGLPFSELRHIDDAVRCSIRRGMHRKAELYMDMKYYHSLRFKHLYDKDACENHEYQDPMSLERSHYYLADRRDLLDALE